MMQFGYIIYFLLLLISTKCWAVSSEILTKYPNVLANDDHGILHDGDIWVHHHEKNNSDDFFSIEKPYNYYWHCFNRENILITLNDYLESNNSSTGTTDLGYVSISGTFTTAELPERFIKRYANKLTDHHIGDKIMLTIEYVPMARTVLSENEKIMHDWRYLMRNQKYVCLLGLVSDMPEVSKLYGGGIAVKYIAEFKTITTKKGSVGLSESDTSVQYAKDYKKWLTSQSKTVQ
jgi:hypothetical protein